jgi:hypothetical protein
MSHKSTIVFLGGDMSVIATFFTKERRKRAAFFAAIVLAVVSVPVFFQNCAPTSSNAYFSAGSVASMAPFAYGVSVDTLAYMSCDGETGATGGQIFTFKVGAFNANSGLQITPNFWQTASDLPQSGMIQAIESTAQGQSNWSAGAYPQLAIRSPIVGLQEYLQNNSNGGVDDGSFGFTSTAPIDNGITLQQYLIAGIPSQWYNNFNFNGSAQPFVAYLDYTTASPEDLGVAYDADGIRSAVSINGSDGFLAIDFTNGTLDVPGSPPTAQGALPQGNNSSIYGIGLQLNFTEGYSLDVPYHQIPGPSRVVASVTETTLASEPVSDGATWSCPYQIMIVRPGIDAGNCGSGSAPPAAVNNMLPPAQWQVFMQTTNLGCAVPKPTTTASGLCYGSNTAGTIGYNTTTNCDASTNSCPHYVTVCIRTSN